MNATFRTAAVIARRDFHATVMSRTFLFFLLAPLFPIIFGILFGKVGATIQHTQPSGVQTLAINASPDILMRLTTTHERLQQATSPIVLEPFELLLPDKKSAKALIEEQRNVSALLVLTRDQATLYGEPDKLEQMQSYIGLLLNETSRDTALKRAGISKVTTTPLTTVPFSAPEDKLRDQHPILGQFSQTLLFVLTLMLAGMLLSNFIEEKGNKVIEILAAAAPMPAIFTGKLFAMLGSSLVGVMVWGIAAMFGLASLLPNGLAALPTPMIGWPAFLVLGLLYFSTNYLLVGALLLGIGAQASSIRQIQTVSLPLTMAQLFLYGLASAAFNQPSHIIALVAAIFPFSSPLTMIAYAAREPHIWPHVLALLWQALWVWITIGITARWFRRGVLKSGPPLSFWPRRRRQNQARKQAQAIT